MASHSGERPGRSFSGFSVSRRCSLECVFYGTEPKQRWKHRRIRWLSLGEVEKAAKEVVHPDQLVWVVVGDLSKVESAIRDLGWGEVRLLDADGNPAK